MNKKLIFIFALLAITTNAAGQVSETNWSPDSDPRDQMALDGLYAYLDQQNTSLELSEVIHCKKQVVAGENYFLTLRMQDTASGKFSTYETLVYVVPWENSASVKEFVELKDTKEFDFQTFKERQQQQHLDGGYHDYDFEESEYKQTILDLIKVELYKQNEEFENFQYISAKSQVVSGTNIVLFFKLNKGDKYEAKIYMQPWTDTYTVSSLTKIYEAKTAVEERVEEIELEEAAVEGGIKQINFEKEEQLVKEFIFEKLTLKFSEDLNSKVEKFQVYDAYKQVVSGLRYVLLFKTDNGKAYKTDFTIQLWKKSITFTYLNEL